MEIKEKPKRIVLEVPEDLHTQVKVRAAKRNIPIRTWVIRAIVAAIKEEEKYE